MLHFLQLDFENRAFRTYHLAYFTTCFLSNIGRDICLIFLHPAIALCLSPSSLRRVRILPIIPYPLVVDHAAEVQTVGEVVRVAFRIDVASHIPRHVL